MKIYTLIIDHRHGTNVYNFLSEAEMNASLYSYVQENWYHEKINIGDLSRDEAIETYFHDDLWSEDWYRTEVAEFPELSGLLTAIKDVHAEVLQFAAERDPDQLGIWDALFTPAKAAIANLAKRVD